MTEEVKTFIDNLATGDNANAGEALIDENYVEWSIFLRIRNVTKYSSTA